jgi:anaerobic magnesium-protoporphyrin IX monomethyl ester cyclase
VPRERRKAGATVVHMVVTPRYIGYPLGAATIAAACRHAGVETELRDYLLHPGDLLDLDNFASFLDGAGDLVWICCGPEALPLLVLALPEVRRRHPGARLVLGERVPLLPKSAGPTAVAEEVLRLCPELDAVAVGESDLTAAELAAALPAWAPPPGMVWRDGGAIRTSPRRERADPIPEWPDWQVSAADLRPYREMYTAGDELYHPIAASRGCVYSCAFCSAAPLWERRQVRRPVTAVVDEIERLHRDTSQTRFSFVDETFVLDRRWVLAFCEELRRRRPGVTWRATGRVNLIDRELLDAMAAAGCESLELGVESGSDAVLARIEKAIDTATTLAMARQAGAAIGHVECNFIWGFPFETSLDLAQSLLVMEALDAMPGVRVKFTFLQPYRPSRIYDEYRDALAFDRFWHRLAPDHPTMHRVLDLVQANPHTFSGFCHLDHPELEEKLRLLQRTGLHEEVMANGFTASLYR